MATATFDREQMSEPTIAKIKIGGRDIGEFPTTKETQPEKTIDTINKGDFSHYEKFLAFSLLEIIASNCSIAAKILSGTDAPFVKKAQVYALEAATVKDASKEKNTLVAS